MNKHRSIYVLIVSCVLVSLLLLGCGSDSTTPVAYDNSKLSGEYVRLLLSNTMSSIGDMTFDGAGNFQLDQVYSMANAAEAARSDAGTYTVDVNGNLVFDLSPLPRLTEGAVTTDGVVYSGVQLNNTNSKYVVAGVRPPTGVFDETDLTGDFHFAFLSFNSGTPHSAFGNITFYGNGIYNAVGVTSDTLSAGNPYADTGTYTTAANGRLTLTRSDGYVYNGAISSTVDVIVASGVKNTTEQSSMVCLEAGTGWTTLNSAGTSRASSLKTSGPGLTTTALGSSTFDGTGVFSFIGVATTNSGIKYPVDRPGTYSIMDNGAFTVETTSDGLPSIINGAIRANGKVSLVSQNNIVEHRLGVNIRQ